jgi:acetyl esterase/lipase
VGYRLTPETYLPETISDVEDALTWCLHNLGGRGIDAQRLVLMGHSAGAILAAHVSVRSDWLRRRGLPLDLIKAAAPISGVYDFSDPSLHQEMFNGDDQRETASPLLRISTPALPQMVVAYGEFENRPDYGVDSERLCEAVTAAGGRAQVLRLTGLDHSQTASALADESSPLFQSVLEVVERTSVPSAIQ